MCSRIKRTKKLIPEGKDHNTARNNYLARQISKMRRGRPFLMPTNGGRDEDILMYIDEPVPAVPTAEHTFRLGDISIDEFLYLEEKDQNKASAFIKEAMDKSQDSIDLWNYLNGGVDDEYTGETRDAVAGDEVSVIIGKTTYEIYDGCMIPCIDDLELLYGEPMEDRKDALEHLYDDRFQAMRDNEYEDIWDHNTYRHEQYETNYRQNNHVKKTYTSLNEEHWRELKAV